MRGTLAAAPVQRDVAERVAAAFLVIGQWLGRPAMARLVEGLGKESPQLGGGQREWLHLNEALPQWLLPVVHDGAARVPGLAPERTRLLHEVLRVERVVADFNGRKKEGVAYVERFQAAQVQMSEELAATIVELSPSLGLVDPAQPRHGKYDMTLVLGGGYRSPLLRARYAAQVKAAGTELGETYFLGSPRFLIEKVEGSPNPPEREVTAAYAPEAVDEFGLMVAAARAEFGLRAGEPQFLCGCNGSGEQCPNWRSREVAGEARTEPEFTHERQTILCDGEGRRVGSVLSASTGRPGFRPDTSDTFGLWARCAQPQFGQRVLVVTTQVFVPFQAFEGLRRLYLPFGLDVDTVGFGAAWGDRPETGPYLLQEILSAVRSARRLLVAAAETALG